MFYLKITRKILTCIFIVFILQIFLFYILDIYIGYFFNKTKKIDLNIIGYGEYFNSANQGKNYFVSARNENIIIINADTGKEIKRISCHGKKPIYYSFVKETDVLLYCFSDQRFENVIIGTYNIYMDSFYEFANTPTLPKGYAVCDSFASAQTNVFYFRLRYKRDCADNNSKTDMLYRYDLFENFEFITYLSKDSNIIVGKTKDFVFFDSNGGILFYDAGNKVIRQFSNKDINKLPYSGVSDEFLDKVIYY